MAFLKGVAATALFVLFPMPLALAHGGAEMDADHIMTTWELTPDIVIATLVVLAVYLHGLWRLRHKPSAASWRPFAFLFGVGFVFIALQSPIDPMADRLFWMHQVQHMLLRIVGPMLIALSEPANFLIAGLPRSLRRAILAPMLSSRATMGFFRQLGRPSIATLLFVISLYFWEIPSIHDAAILNDGIHYIMHVTMLAAGLLFFVRIFDARPAPKGISYGIRLMMLWISVLTNLLLGALTALKPVAIYSAYDIAGRLFDTPAVSDEQVGGVLIWIPSNMMCLLAILLTVHAMGVDEERRDTRHRQLLRSGSNSAAQEWPITGAELITRSRAKNRQMAFGFIGFSATIFATTILVSLFVLQFEHLNVSLPEARQHVAKHLVAPITVPTRR
jgi:putative membrane protein